MFLMLIHPLLLILFIEEISFVWCVNDSYRASGDVCACLRLNLIHPAERSSGRNNTHTHTHTHVQFK